MSESHVEKGVMLVLCMHVCFTCACVYVCGAGGGVMLYSMCVHHSVL